MICPQCGKQATGNFCSECGAGLPQEPPANAPAAPAAPAASVAPAASAPSAAPVARPASPLLARFGLVCPVCAAQAMHETDVKGLFHTRRELVCGRCGSVFVDHEGRGERFELTDTRNPAWG
jgi:hypothetical protein